MKKYSEKDILLFHSRFLKQKDYWSKKLSPEFDTTDILFGFDKFPGQGNVKETGKIDISFPDELAARMIKLSKASDLSLYILLLAALKTLVFRYTANEEIIILSPINKLIVTTETINGLLFIHDRVYSSMSFKEMVLNVRQSVLEAHANQDYPFDKLLEYLLPPPEEQNTGMISNILCSLGNLHDDRDIKKINARLCFHFLKEGERISGQVLYDTATCKRSEVTPISNHLLRLSANALEKINAAISDISFLTDREKKQLLMDFNDNRADFSRERTIFHFIEEHAEKTPESTAIVFNHAEMTYRDLSNRANQLARFLQDKGVREDQPVGILMGRSNRMVESILAIWKAGGAYIPLDPAYPWQRILEILEDSRTGVLITASKYIDSNFEASYSGTIIKLDRRNEAGLLLDRNLGWQDKMNRLSYIIYTSGSTGRPKGVMVEHIGMMNHIQAKINDLHLTAESVVAQNASHTFDISVWQFFVALTLGGKTIIYPDEVVFEPDRFITRLVEDRVTCLEVVPSYLAAMLEALDSNFKSLDSIRYLLVTGEIVKPKLVKKWFERHPGIKMVNAYGPTEASDDITHFIMDALPEGDRIPIGKTLQNLNIFIVDDRMNPCPLGVKGEICVSGIGVGRGYLNNPELTAGKFDYDLYDLSDYDDENKRFLQGVVSKVQSKERKADNTINTRRKELCTMHLPPGRQGSRGVGTLYKTGDLGRWVTDGTIEFFGRKDYQVKIRGFRIELGDIENQLTHYSKIKEAVVIVKAENLFAFLVAEEKLDIPALRNYISARLPYYMLPGHFLELEHMPLTPNGKIDRKALARLDTSVVIGKEHAAPRNNLEKRLVNIWSDMLGIQQAAIGIDDNFFELGGHSLKAIKLITKIHDEFKVKISLVDIFKISTINGLAGFIKDKAEDTHLSIEVAEEKEYHPLSSVQERLYVLNQLHPGDISYNVPIVMNFEGKLDIPQLEETFAKLVKRHESLRTSFHLVNEKPVQVIHDDREFEIEYKKVEVDVVVEEREGTRGLIPRSADPAAALISSFILPFDLSQAPLLRMGLIKTGVEAHIFMVDMHHIITDGNSVNILKKEFLGIYGGEDLPSLRLQYKDYTQWQIQDSDEKQNSYIKQGKYWLAKFKDKIPALKLPLDYPRPEKIDFQGDIFHFALEKELTGQLNQMAKETETTLYMILLSAFNILLYKYSRQEDILVGSPVAGRNHSDLQNIIGMFVNMIAMRNFPSGNKCFRDFLKEVKINTLEAFENQDFQWEDLVSKLGTKGTHKRNLLFSTVLALGNIDDIKTDFDKLEYIKDLKISSHQYEKKTSKFDILLGCVEVNDTLQMHIEYSTSLFKRATVKKMSKRFVDILEQIKENPGIKLQDIRISYDLLTVKSTAFQEDDSAFDI